MADTNSAIPPLEALAKIQTIAKGESEAVRAEFNASLPLLEAIFPGLNAPKGSPAESCLLARTGEVFALVAQDTSLSIHDRQTLLVLALVHKLATPESHSSDENDPAILANKKEGTLAHCKDWGKNAGLDSGQCAALEWVLRMHLNLQDMLDLYNDGERRERYCSPNFAILHALQDAILQANPRDRAFGQLWARVLDDEEQLGDKAA